MSRLFSLGLVTIATVLGSACSDSSAPSDGSAGGTTASLAAVSPAPGTTGVSTSTGITMTFGQPMMAGMEQYMDLHQGGVTGPTVPMSCGWSADHATLTCTPSGPLAGGTMYTIHMGAGMTDSTGQMVGMGDWTAMGGHWATAAMMSGGGMMGGGMHDGEPLDMMGSGWTHGDHYGMLFTFTTS